MIYVEDINTSKDNYIYVSADTKDSYETFKNILKDIGENREDPEDIECGHYGWCLSPIEVKSFQSFIDILGCTKVEFGDPAGNGWEAGWQKLIESKFNTKIYTGEKYDIP